jgi:trehalose utilization protein
MNNDLSNPLESLSSSLSRRRMIGLTLGASAGLCLGSVASAAAAQRRVLVWSEGTAATDAGSKEVYPKDINTAVAEGLKTLAGWEVITAGLKDPDQGVPDELLKKTDVLMWWGHKKHGEVKDELVQKIYNRVKEEGMGFIALHSSHFAKPYKKIMGTACSWREYKADGTSVKITIKDPNHPITRGVKDFALPKIERYGEPFAVPTPESVPLEGIYTKPDGSTEPGRMGLCWTVGKGRVFYFTPGHETYDDFYRPEVQQIMRNAVEWAAPK